MEAEIATFNINVIQPKSLDTIILTYAIIIVIKGSPPLLRV